MEDERLLVKGRKVVIGDGIVPASIIVKNGKIIDIIYDYNFEMDDSVPVIDGGNLVIMPGIVDSHVHVNEPGRTEWEGYETATKAAATGGITTIVDMPLNCVPVTTSMSAFSIKLKEAADKAFVDVAFWGGVIPGNQSELRPMINAGISGFKCFLIHSGIDEFPKVSEYDLHNAMVQLRRTDSVLLFHAEMDVDDIPSAEDKNPQAYQTFVESRPDSMELEAVKLVCKLCVHYRVPCHIVHLSSAECLPLIQVARAQGGPLTCETCHHYLSFDAESIPDKDTSYKCCPPIRSKQNQETLWEALKSGIIDLVVSDHSPCTADLKQLDTGDFMKAWGGISSLQFGLSSFWTSARQRSMTVFDIVRLMCENTAKLAGIHTRKGKISRGYDADFVIWDPNESFVITEEIIQHKNKVTPYMGKRLNGVVHQTIVRGNTVYKNGRVTVKPYGELILKSRSAKGKL
ncbi:allantoinase, mitochondrial-like isoform X2 [Tubulanus polymorphus]|uniref:allantoinase, mitochondrial-like isoform X2 n=1 Tax=Tubulanus polymorphus TaxID=672921 RepID=UPI003DA4498D